MSAGGPQPGSSQGVDSGDPNADLSTDLPSDVSQTIGGSAPVLNQAVAAQQLSGPSSSAAPDPDPDPVQTNQPGPSINPDFQPEYSFTDMPDNSQPSQAIAQTRAANSLMSQPSVTQPTVAPGYSTAGTRPHTGGVAELDLQKEILAQQIQKASLADKLAEAAGTGRYAKRALPVTKQGVTMTGGNGSVWDGVTGNGSGSSGKSKASPKYVAGSGNFETDETTDNPDQIRTDFEAFHPGIDLGDFAGATRDTQGNYIIPGKPGKDAQGNSVPTVKATIPKAEGDVVMQRMDAARKRAGLPSNNGAVPAGFGTQDNPVPLSGSKLQLRSLATGTWVIDPATGKKYKVGA